MPESFIESFKTVLIESGLAKLHEIKGCSDEDMEKLCKDQSVACLPSVYTQFMKLCGKNCGTFQQGTDSRFHEIFNMKIALVEDIKFFERAFVIPDDAFIFMCHHGYAWWYFHTENCVDDPQVYLYHGDKDKVTLISESLSEFFIDGVQEHIRIKNAVEEIIRTRKDTHD